MHLVVLAEDFYPNTSGGAHTRWRFCEIAAEKGHEITVFTPRIEGTPSEETVSGVHIKRPFPAKPESLPAYSPISVITRILFSILLFPYVLLWFRGKDIDGIHSASHSMHWVAKALSLYKGVPLVSFVGYSPSVKTSWKPTPKFLLEWLNLRFFTGEVVFTRIPEVKEKIRGLTDGRVELLHGILETEKIQAVADSVNRDKIRSQLGISDQQILIVFVGRLVPIKNPSMAVDIIAELPDRYVLVIVGDGPERDKVQNKIRHHGLGGRVKLKGMLPHTETLEIIVASDAVLITSEAESYSAAALEGLALGSHVFTTFLGILPSVKHYRLHVGGVNEIVEEISQTDFCNTWSIDKNFVDNQSMERYTRDIVGSFEELRTQDINQP